MISCAATNGGLKGLSPSRRSVASRDLIFPNMFQFKKVRVL